MSNPYAAPRVDEPGEGRSTNGRARPGALVLATLAGPLLGYIIGDWIVSPHPETRSLEVLFGALMLAPFSVPLHGGAIGPLLGYSSHLAGRPLLGFLFVVGGLSFWPVYLWLSWRWLRSRGSILTLASIDVWLFLGYFKIAQRFEIMMSV